ncbi:MAG: transposase [Sumerlaeia bacterium]
MSFVGDMAKDYRLFIVAVLYRYRAGIPWRDLPERFGEWKNFVFPLARCCEKGFWLWFFEAFSNDPDNEYTLIDATIVQPYQHAAGAKKDPEATSETQCIGRSRIELMTRHNQTFKSASIFILSQTTLFQKSNKSPLPHVNLFTKHSPSSLKPSYE